MKYALVLLVGWMLLSPGTPVLATEAPAPSAVKPSEAGSTTPPDWLLEIAAQSRPETQMTVTSPTDPLWLQAIQTSSCVYCSFEECGCCACVWHPFYGCCWYCC